MLTFPKCFVIYRQVFFTFIASKSLKLDKSQCAYLLRDIITFVMPNWFREFLVECMRMNRNQECSNRVYMFYMENGFETHFYCMVLWKGRRYSVCRKRVTLLCKCCTRNFKISCKALPSLFNKTKRQKNETGSIRQGPR